jgi:hypothetical protein
MRMEKRSGPPTNIYPFVDNTTCSQVGGAMFGAFTDEELANLEKDRKEFPKAESVGRGGQFQPWTQGMMHARGSRMPSGGRPGDTYTSYTAMKVADGDVVKIKKGFTHAKVSVQ